MNGLFSKATLFLVMCFYLTQPAFSEEITLYAEDGWPPYSNADGTGISNQKMIEAFAIEGVKVNIQVLPFARILNLLKSGKALVGINVAKTPETEAQFRFHNSPLFEAHSHFYYWFERPLATSHKEQLSAGIRIGAIIGYDYGKFIDENNNGLKIERVKSHQQNIKKLESNRLDAVVLFDDVANELIKEHQLTGKLLKGPPSDSIKIYAAFSKAHPDTQKYLTLLDSGLSKLKQQSESR